MGRKAKAADDPLSLWWHDAEKLLHGVHKARPRTLPSDDVLRDLAWIMQAMRARHHQHQRRRRKPLARIDHSYVAAKLKELVEAGPADAAAIAKKLNEDPRCYVPLRVTSRDDIARRLGAEFADAWFPRAEGDPQTWHDTAKFLADWYRKEVNPRARISRNGPVCRFVLEVFKHASLQVTINAIEQALIRKGPHSRAQRCGY
jgi:hypothetical protein